MIRDFGIIRPGTTLYIPFHTFDSNDPSASVTLTGLATTDIEIYKDGSTTQRASDNGYALLDTDGIDFDGVTGIHGISIDLADNSTAGFYAAGSQYWVVISSVTVDAATINFVLCTFRIGYPNALFNTTIASLSSQTSFTLTTGPAEDDALNGSIVCIHDVASAVQCGYAVISDYTGSSKTVTLTAGTTFTAAATDNISIYPPVNAAYGGAVAYSTTRGLSGTALPNAAADAAGGLPISDAGGLDLDAKIGALTYGTANRVNVQVYGMEAGTVTAAAIATGAIDADAIADNAIDAGALAADCITAAKIADGAIDAGSIATGAITSAKFAAGAIDAAAIANGAIDAATFAADVDAEILSYLVDDATRIDASALNTLSGHDPGATLGTSTLTQTQVTGGAYAINSASFSFNAAVNNAIADQVWDEDATGHQTTGTFGKAIGDPGIEGDTIWETLITNLDTTVSSRASSSAMGTAQADLDIITGANGVIIATGTQTFNMTGNITGNLSGSVGSVTGAVGSVTGNVGGNVVGSVASVTGNVGGNVVGSVASVTGAVGSVTGNVGGSVGSVTGGINTGSGVITTLDALDTAQDTQHGTTRTKLLKYTQLLARKDAAIATDNATEVTEINANGGSGAGGYANTTDSQESIRDRGDAAWTSGGGGSSYLATGTVASTTGTTTTLDAGAVATTSYYVDAKLVITGGTGAGQERLITGYTSGRVATHLAWTTNPTGASTYEIRDARASVVVAGAGSGANSVNPTVDDGTDPLEGAKVRFTKGAESYIQTMEADGQPTTPFGLDTGTWAVVVTMPGYDSIVTTLAVSANASPTYTMTLTGPAADPDPDKVAAYLYLEDEDGAIEGAEWSAVLTNPPSGEGSGFAPTEQSGESAASGLITFVAYAGGHYRVTIAGKTYRIIIPADADDPYPLANALWGCPEAE